MTMNERLYNLPLRTCGNWRIEQRTFSEAEASACQLHAAINGNRRYTPAGTYVGLLRGEHVIMSNTPDELHDLYLLKWNAKGHVLIAGLGLGCAVDVALAAPDVSEVTVIEQSLDVIELVAHSFTDSRLTILQGDIFTWRPPKGQRYGAAWFDIWDDICEDNLAEMAKLHRRFARVADWKGSWCRDECERMRERWRRSTLVVFV